MKKLGTISQDSDNLKGFSYESPNQTYNLAKKKKKFTAKMNIEQTTLLSLTTDESFSILRLFKYCFFNS